MKFFIDTANLDQIREANDLGRCYYQSVFNGKRGYQR